MIRFLLRLALDVVLGLLSRPEPWDYVSTTDPGPVPAW